MGDLRPAALQGGRWSVAAALAVLLAACGGGQAAVTRFDDARVEVRLSVDASNGGRTIVAEFVPTEAGLHLYGMELPDDGIDGAGRPTRLEVVDPAWRAVGPAVGSVAAHAVPMAGFSQPFPVYPDGPVTLRRPIESTGTGRNDDPIGVSVTFMACSTNGVCFRPVVGEHLAVPQPAS